MLGADCTVEVGTVAGIRSTLDRLRLVYFDAHPDLNVPGAVVDGAFDWMGVAHMLNLPGANPEVATAAGMAPVLELDELMLLANSPHRSSEHELRVIAEHGIANIVESDVAADPAGAGAARGRVGERVRWLPGSPRHRHDRLRRTAALREHRPQRQPLLRHVMDGLDVLLAGDRFAALTVTEVNPHHGEPDGKTVATFVERLVRSLGRMRREA